MSSAGLHSPEDDSEKGGHIFRNANLLWQAVRHIQMALFPNPPMDEKACKTNEDNSEEA